MITVKSWVESSWYSLSSLLKDIGAGDEYKDGTIQALNLLFEDSLDFPLIA